MNRYFLDVRNGKIVKNLDITYLAPELYFECLLSHEKDTYTEE